MAVSRLTPGSGANDFNLSLTSQYTSVTFNKEYSSGSYSIISNSGDSTFDIYAYNTDGSLAGYTNSGSFTASKGFNKMVVIGGTVNDVLSFSYKTTFTTVDDSDEVTAGPVITSVSPASVPNVDDTFVITGRNFASDITVSFSATGYTTTPAKNIVRSSATSLIVTRPDNLTSNLNPYTITLSNPGVPNPTGSASHILQNAITAGVSPVWTTPTILNYTIGSSYDSSNLVATDPDGHTVSYSIVSGTVPAGLNINLTTGVITGLTNSTAGATVVFRATSAMDGGFTDRSITFNPRPVWVTGVGPHVISQNGSFTLSATDNTSVTYSIQSGTLPVGVSLNSSTGVLTGSGTTAGSSEITFRATDSNNGFSDRTMTIVHIGYYDFSSFTFTNAGITGRFGPTLAQCQSSYGSTAWTQNTTNFNMTTQGIQRWTVPITGNYRILAVGAAGGRSQTTPVWGYGTSMQGEFSLTAGEVINILVGQGGTGGPTHASNYRMAGGGGGGTVVWRNSSDSEPLIAAGGGAGGTDQPQDYSGRHQNINATTSTSGRSGYSDAPSSRGAGGSGGNGGGTEGSQSDSLPGAGAGYKSSGAPNGQGSAAQLLRTSGVGGACNTLDTNRTGNGGGAFHGGFGGGGGAAGWYGCSGGGGGYSGGGAADDSPRTAAGGGGSYNAGINQSNGNSINNSNSSGIGGAGYVTITRL